MQGVILAGGKGRRVGGNFKGGLLYHGQPLIQHVVQRIQPQVDALVINANNIDSVFEQINLPVFPDAPQWQDMGPLAGVATSFTLFPDQWVFFAPVDMPQLPEDIVSQLWQHKKDCRYCYASADNRDHPLVAVAHGSLLPDLKSYLAQGERRVMQWLKQIDACSLEFSDAQAFVNLNRLECFT